MCSSLSAFSLLMYQKTPVYLPASVKKRCSQPSTAMSSGNCTKNGLLPVTVGDATARWLLENPGAEVDIDLAAARLTLPDGTATSFPIEAFARHCLLNGIDELGYLRSKLDLIESYEAAHRW